MSGSKPRPALSIVVVAYDIARELPRTLRTLAEGYQRGVSAQDYEIIVVDNGSPTPLSDSIWQGLQGQFRLHRLHNAPASPAGAANWGLAHARGEVIGVMIDGARMVTPGLIRQAIDAVGQDNHVVCGAAGWYLGHDIQRHAQTCGYTQEHEDALLQSVDWQADGYRLYEISAMDESSTDIWHANPAEFNALFMTRAAWGELEGFDARFALPGGGLLNLDMYQRAIERPDAHLRVLSSEATFHQLHGGIATNTRPEKAVQDWERWHADYQALRARSYSVPEPRARSSWGQPLSQQEPHFSRSALLPRRDAFPNADPAALQAWASAQWAIAAARSQHLPTPHARVFAAIGDAVHQAQLGLAVGWLRAWRSADSDGAHWRVAADCLSAMSPWLKLWHWPPEQVAEQARAQVLLQQLRSA